MERTLQDVISHIKGCTVTGDPKNKIITDLTIDSRTAGKGSLFICLVGVHTDGHAYIEKAASLGAEAVLVEKDVPHVPGLVMIRVKSTQETMTELAPWFYDYPAQKMRMIGITGTNGKTTTTNILRTLLTNTGHKVGLIGTINIMIGDEVEASHNTTPDVVDLQRTLCRMADAGCDYVVMEVSSHALALNRVAGIEYDTAALTNITQDHLDFHKTMENYREAKALLFTHLHEGRKKGKTAIFNMDDASSPLIMNRVKTKVMTYGKARTNDVYPIRFHVGAKHMELSLHTPDGLDNVLRTARQITKGRLWAVFGCGGDRDAKKRPIMGKLALELADILVVTSDNPRSDDPDTIIRDIETGFSDNPQHKEIYTISDRREAIQFAISHARPEDVIMIAGKGHENYQILKDRTIHFDDGEVVRDFFRKGNRA